MTQQIFLEFFSHGSLEHKKFQLHGAVFKHVALSGLKPLLAYATGLTSPSVICERTALTPSYSDGRMHWYLYLTGTLSSRAFHGRRGSVQPKSPSWAEKTEWYSSAAVNDTLFSPINRKQNSTWFYPFLSFCWNTVINGSDISNTILSWALWSLALLSMRYGNTYIFIFSHIRTDLLVLLILKKILSWWHPPVLQSWLGTLEIK